MPERMGSVDGVSYVQAQQQGTADLDIFAEVSVIGPGTQGIYTLPGSPVTTLADLKGQTVAINAPDSISRAVRVPRSCSLADAGAASGQVTHLATSGSVTTSAASWPVLSASWPTEVLG